MQNLKMFAQTLRACDRSQTDGQADLLDPSGTSYRAVRGYQVLIRGLAHYFTISLLSGRDLM